MIRKSNDLTSAMNRMNKKQSPIPKHIQNKIDSQANNTIEKQKFYDVKLGKPYKGNN